MAPPTLYVDLMSQPSRACYILCKAHDLPVQISLLRLDRGEHKQPQYLSLNPLGKVPFLVDGDLRLPESAAILLHLAAKFSLPPAWHPPRSSSTNSNSTAEPAAADAVAAQRALFDAALHWQHLTIRLGCTRFVFNTVIGPRVFKVPASPAVAAHGLAVLQQSLRELESFWLQGGRRRFMTGEEASLPDLLCCCELEQLRMLVAEPSQPQLPQLLAPHPLVQQWMADVRRAVGQEAYDDTHAKLAAAVQRLAAAATGGGAAPGGGDGQRSRL